MPYEECVLLVALPVLDYLYQHPTTPHRERLLESLVDLTHRLSLFAWLAPAWLNQSVRVPLETMGRVPPTLTERWHQEKRGQVIETDLDGNAEPDYVINVRFGNLSSFGTRGGLYWLRHEQGIYRMSQIDTAFYGDSQYAQIKAVRDLNGDQRPDLAYTVDTCGASTCFEKLYVLTWHNGAWQSLLYPDWWEPMNGKWTIHEQSDGTIELIADKHGPAIVGLGPFAAYNIHFRMNRGKFMPTTVSLLGADEATTRLEWADVALHAGLYHEAARILATIVNDKPPSPWIDFKPNALFRLGMVHLFLGDVTSAQQDWEYLVKNFPNHPAARDLVQARTLVHQPDDAWQVCAWLDRNSQGWFPSEHPGPIGNSYFFYLGWNDICDPTFILKVWRWSRQTPLEAQLARRGLGWQLLSNDYDLNSDGWADLIGIVDFGVVKTPWVWLSQGDTFQPRWVADSTPPGAIAIDGIGPYKDTLRCQSIRVLDLDNNRRPEVLFQCRYHIEIWEWTGDIFSLHQAAYPNDSEKGTVEITPHTNWSEVKTVALDMHDHPTAEWLYRWEKGTLTRIHPPQVIAPPPSIPPSLLANALAALYGEHHPSRTMEILRHVTLTQPWERATAQYLRAAALAYHGDTLQARAAFSALAREFPASQWARLAKQWFSDIDATTPEDHRHP